MPDLFISHVEADSSVALRIAEGLEAEGYSTWCYEHQGLPGVSYLEQTGSAIENSRAFILLISPTSLTSKQVDSEVVRAHECGRPFVPILLGMSHAEFQQQKPGWRQAVGSATSIQISLPDLVAALQRLVLGLRMLGIEPSTGQRATDADSPSLAATTDPAGRLEGRHDSTTPAVAETLRPQDPTHRRARGAGSPRSIARAIGIVSLITALCVGLWLWRPLLHRPGPILQRPLTSFPAGNPVMSAALSPDGEFLAFVDSSGYYLLRIKTNQIRSLPGVDGVPIPGEDDCRRVQFAWFPDNKTMVIGTSSHLHGTVRDSLWIVSLIEQRSRRLRDGCRIPAVSRDGQLLCVGRVEDGEALWRLDSDGSNARVIPSTTRGRRSYEFIAWSASGRRVAYLASEKTDTQGGGDESPVVPTRPVLETCDLEGRSKARVLSSAWLGAGWGLQRGLCWLPDGRLLYYLPDSTRNQDQVDLWAIHLDPVRGTQRGRPVCVLQTAGYYLSDLTCSADGKRLCMIRSRTQTDVYLADLQDGGHRAEHIRRLTLDEHMDIPTGWTPDSRAVVFISTRSQLANMYRQDIDARLAEPILEPPITTQWVAYTSDGAWILYYPDRPSAGEPGRRFMRVPVAGGPSSPIAGSDSTWEWIRCGSTPGSRCVVSRQEAEQTVFYELDPLTGPRAEMARIHLSPAEQIAGWHLSPDGRHLAVESEGHALVLDLQTGRKLKLVQEGWTDATLLGWASDEAVWLHAARGQREVLLRADLSGDTREAGPLEFWSSVCASPDGRHLAFDRQTREANAWLIEGL
jgi:eukaryotic-like serine/threonine-protein kinase